ncbi:DUF779 domain-containing protein [Microlunatus soli]|uniref:DUF779 domain-containing protein n=1 Tax=Microlunatus soli TaxID=630515 RepID=A0A1H1Z3Y7_9ACTN|nr:DUF779 domain-containing protein [Microlunatus soli]SDT28378.1 hypothetical protein SAMN04489812_4966 [Microlunatus soli]
MTERVALTESAAELLRELWVENGPLMFHQSGGCCDGSAPMCFPEGEFLTSDADVRLGELDLGDGRTVPVWMSAEQYAYWRHTHLTIDVVPGRGSGFSLESPTGKRFLIRSRLLDDPESAPERVAPVPPAGSGSPSPRSFDADPEGGGTTD